jgi:5,10-methylenetetrahydromethanopterin reductase
VSLSVGLAIDGHESLAEVLARVADLDRGDAIASLWVADERFRRDVWASLGALAASTHRLRLATCVTDPFVRHPALTGAAVATIADLAPGRTTLGLGAGASGFGALGIRREQPARALRETIEFLRRFWTGETVSHDGQSFTFQDARLGFRPPGDAVPIAIAGRGPLILELAGELADEVLVATFLDGPLLDASLARVAAGEARRDATRPRLHRTSWAYVAIDDDRRAARDAVRRGIAVAIWGSRPIVEAIGVPLPAPLRRFMDQHAYSIEPETIDQAAALIPDELVGQCSLAGTPEDVAAGLHRLTGRGFAEVACWLFETPAVGQAAMVRRLADDVVPQLRRLEAGDAAGAAAATQPAAST